MPAKKVNHLLNTIYLHDVWALSSFCSLGLGVVFPTEFDGEYVEARETLEIELVFGLS